MVATRLISARVGMLFLVSTFSWLLVGCKPSGGTPSVDLSAADEAAATSIRAYQDLARTEPTNAQRRGELGVVYELHGYMHAAIAEYEAAIDLEPLNPLWHYYRALLSASQEGLESGLRGMNTVIELDDLYAPAWLWRGTWLLDLSKVEDAEHSFARARDLGSYLPSKVGLARAKLVKGEVDSAIADFEEMVNAYEFPYLRQLLGTAYLKSGQTVRAREVLETTHGAPALGWRDPWVEEKAKFFSEGLSDKLVAAQLVLQAGDRVEALESLRALRQQYPQSTRVIHTLSLVLRLNGDDVEAVSLLEQALKDHPTHYAFYLELAELLKAEGKLVSALSYLEKSIEIDSNLVFAWSMKGEILMSQKKWREAQDAFMAALKIDSTDVVLIVNAGWTNGMINQWEQAAELFQQAIFIDRDYVPAYLNLARALAIMGNFEDAENILNQAREVGAPGEHIEVVRDQLRTIQGGSS